MFGMPMLQFWRRLGKGFEGLGALSSLHAIAGDHRILCRNLVPTDPTLRLDRHKRATGFQMLIMFLCMVTCGH